MIKKLNYPREVKLVPKLKKRKENFFFWQFEKHWVVKIGIEGKYGLAHSVESCSLSIHL